MHWGSFDSDPQMGCRTSKHPWKPRPISSMGQRQDGTGGEKEKKNSSKESDFLGRRVGVEWSGVEWSGVGNGSNIRERKIDRPALHCNLEEVWGICLPTVGVVMVVRVVRLVRLVRLAESSEREREGEGETCA
jgi:hypothetical protein